MTKPLERGLHALWGQAKASPEYDKQPWLDFQEKLQRAEQQSEDVAAKLRSDDRGGVAPLFSEPFLAACEKVVELARSDARDLRELRAFAKTVIEGILWHDDVDGGDVQEDAESHGLIEHAPGGFDPEKHGPADAEPGDPWYVLTPRVTGEAAS